MRPGTIAKIVAALVLVLVVAVIAAGKSLKSDAYNAFLAERVKAATGLDLTFAGATKLKLGPSPVLSFTGVTLSVGNGAAGKGADILYVDRIEARVALVPLALHQLRLESLSLFRPVLHAANLPRLGQAKSLDIGAPPAGAPLTRLALAEVGIEDAAIRWSGGTVQVAKAVIRPESEAGGPLSLQLAGRWQDRSFDLTGVIGPLSALGGAKPYPVQLKGALGGATLTLRGAVASPLAAKGLDFDIRAQGEELAELLRLRPGKGVPQAFGPFKLAARLSDSAGPLALADIDAIIGRRDSLLITAKGQVADAAGPGGVDLSFGLEAESLAAATRLLGLDLPNAGPVKLSAKLSDIEGGWRLTGMKSTLGRSDLAGEVSLVLAPRPRIYGRLAAAQLNLGDFSLPSPRGAPPAQASQPQRPAIPIDDGRILGTEPLILDLVRDMDANLSLAATRLQAGPATLADAAGELTVASGRMALAGFTARAGEGKLAGEIKLDAAAKTPALALRLTAAGADPALLTAGALKGAKADLALDLKAQGTNLRNLAGSAEGSLALTLGETVLARNSGTDLPARLARDIAPNALESDGLHLRCLVARLPVKAGLISLDRGLGAETAAAAALAMGSIDLRTEAVDVTFVSRTAPPLKVRGVLGNPAVATEGTAKAAADSSPCRTAQARRLAR
ncbi:conserved exported protein of unknown function [Magnetospirillum sp. XM-1]|uniref:AsmA family protein n=1 Tax=Magnetospirillum sp. XM-1 TaxID=1663591 RepID=UPI00073DE635|nr:AsmA family protein [Magnetospirillum sp. XM-1]CUW39190.1 conserved exported protein of unknown function [Magnetospirillum sp. XM-1]